MGCSQSAQPTELNDNHRRSKSMAVGIAANPDVSAADEVLKAAESTDVEEEYAPVPVPVVEMKDRSKSMAVQAAADTSVAELEEALEFAEEEEGEDDEDFAVVQQQQMEFPVEQQQTGGGGGGGGGKKKSRAPAAAVASVPEPTTQSLIETEGFEKTLSDTVFNRLLVDTTEALREEIKSAKDVVASDESNAHAWTMYVRVEETDIKGSDDWASAFGDDSDVVVSPLRFRDEVDRPETPSNDIIESVVFHLHPTFVPNRVTKRESPFKVGPKVGWGYFTIKCEISTSDGSRISVLHELNFDQTETYRVYRVGTRYLRVGNLYQPVEESSEDSINNNNIEDAGNKLLANMQKARGARRALLAKNVAKWSAMLEGANAVKRLVDELPHSRRKMGLGAYLAGVLAGDVSEDYMRKLY